MAVDITIQETIDSVDITVNPNIIEVNVTRTSGGGGGGSQTLSQTLAFGNSTGGENILVNNTDAIELENSSKLSQGIVDAGTGGNKGIALTCAVGFEWKFEAGEAYLTETTSEYIRLKQYARSLPTIDDDISKGFVNGSFWYLDSGIAYICTDSTNGAAVWEIYHNFIPTLQQVVNEGGQLTDLGIAFDSVVNPSLTAGINIDGLSFIDNDGIDEETTVYASNGIQRNLNENGTLLNFETPTNPDNIVLVPNATGTLALTSDIPAAGVTSVGLTMPSAFTVTNSPITSSGDIAVTGAGAVSQYVRGDGTLANFPTSSGGGSSLSFYLNGSVSQGTIGGVAFREMDRTPILGAGTDFTINANGYIQSFITDAGVPNLLEIPAGNWNFETYFSASSGGGSPSFYVELYKWDGTTLSLIASNSANPEFITGGTNTDLYVSALAVPQTTLLATDRLAVRIYVTHSSKTITLHTENSNLCQVITTFSTGLTALNGLTAQVQNLATGTSGTDFGIVSSGSTHTFNLPDASAANRGLLTSDDWSTFNAKQNNLKTFNTTQGIYFFDDFMGNLVANITNTTNGFVTSIGNGQGTLRTTSTITNRTNQQGVVEALTSANATGTAGYYYSGGVYKGSGAISIETSLNFTTLSVLGERFCSLFGFYTGVNYQNPPNAIMIVYDEGGAVVPNAATPNFRCVTRIGAATITNTVTSIPVVAGQWFRLRINISNDGNTVTFFINNALVATHTTNIPLNATFLPVGCMLQKTSGTAARAMQTDYFMYEEIFTNPR